MSWWQFSLRCPADQLDRVEARLGELGALSISLADAGDEPIFEPTPGETPIWSESIVTGTFDAKLDPESLQQQLLASLPSSLAASLRQAPLYEQDWEQAYRAHFKPLQCAEKLWIVPSWSEAPDKHATVIHLDPGLAFGTGTHATTSLCLSWIAEQQLSGRELIDYGCGSGILAIAACKLGADRVRAVDIDPQALLASAANMRRNQIDATRILLAPPDDMAMEPADILLANILAGPLIELAVRFSELVKPGGKIMLSGILKTQLNEIQSAYQPYFELEPPRFREEWVGLSGTRTEQV